MRQWFAHKTFAKVIYIRVLQSFNTVLFLKSVVKVIWSLIEDVGNLFIMVFHIVFVTFGFLWENIIKHLHVRIVGIILPFTYQDVIVGVILVFSLLWIVVKYIF